MTMMRNFDDSAIRARPFRRNIVWGVIAFCCLGSLALCFAYFQGAQADYADFRTVSAKARNYPLVIPQASRLTVETVRAMPEFISGRMQPSDVSTIDLSLALHLMRLHGPNFQIAVTNKGTPFTVLSVLCDDRIGSHFFGAAPMTVTDWGVRYSGPDSYGQPRKGWRSVESHRDHLLAVMAETGVPLSQEIRTSRGEFTLRDVLSDSLAQFHLSQRELAWTAYAYTFYLPPQRTWINRYGEQFSFDDVATELLNRPLASESCSGMHLVSALLAVSCIASEGIDIISSETQVRIDDRLAEWLSLAIANQHYNGSWNPEWWDNNLSARHSLSRSDATADELCLIATSHITEWLFALPNRFRVPEDTMIKATHWLLSRIRSASEEEMIDQYCGYSHACTILQKICHK